MARASADLKKRINEMLRVVDATEGWSYTPGAHSWKIRTPAGTQVFIPKTPSEYRGVKNVEAQLARHGLPVKRKR